MYLSRQMEASSMEVLSEGEWSSLSDMYTTEEANFMAQLLGTNNNNNLQPLNPELHLNSGSASGLKGCLDWYDTPSSSSANFFSQTPNGPVHHHHHHHHESDHYLNLMSNPNLSTFPNGRVFLTQSSDIGDNNKYLNHDDDEHMIMSNNVQQLKEDQDEPTKENVNSSFESSRKRSRSTGNIEKLKRNVKLKKTQSLELSTVEDGSNNSRAHKSITCCSEQDESSLSQEPATLNLSGRTRASRGAATDPQSLYARKRRERINERLKVLQRLIPNGTKVDISTMLEEAVHYVRFLQLQIKVLSSDDHWMFAPIAYNGIDLGLDMRRIDTLMR